MAEGQSQKNVQLMAAMKTGVKRPNICQVRTGSPPRRPCTESPLLCLRPTFLRGFRSLSQLGETRGSLLLPSASPSRAVRVPLRLCADPGPRGRHVIGKLWQPRSGRGGAGDGRAPPRGSSGGRRPRARCWACRSPRLQGRRRRAQRTARPRQRVCPPGSPAPPARVAASRFSYVPSPALQRASRLPACPPRLSCPALLRAQPRSPAPPVLRREQPSHPGTPVPHVVGPLIPAALYFPVPDLHGKLGEMDRVVLGWIAVFWLTAVAEGLQVTVPDKRKVAMLFQPAVLRCHFSTSSHRPAVVQWKFKSYCQDRMGESLGMSSPRAQSLSKRNLEWDPYLDCLDSRRTVRVVASKQGSTVTLGDFYRGREITIVHDADLQIGKLMWGDSGLYYCVITTPDDLEGKNEDSVELLVLGRTGLLADLLPSFAVEIMPEWVFVGLVILGVFLFFVLVGICWCQCCPHSCCCYVRCPCCPDSCCCPQALYEAGKAAKAGYPPSVSGVPGPFSIPSVPLGGTPSSGMLMDKPHPPPLAPSDSTGGSHSVRKGYRIQADKERDSMKVLYYVEKELAQFDPARRMRGRYNNTISELSSLHEEDSSFRQSYHQMRSKQFPVSGDLESNPDYWSGVMGSSSGASRGPSALEYNKEDRESFRHSQQRSKSEMLSRKNFAPGVPAVSMD
ncbi:immunoglobulin-like domain-containing receptor 2, partial [Marmota marmota marmota]|uniref:immunoglobulin-like domain-containing receptor 2 n=1 Tax=Marmota marmota marmota TaxID=9994 RepID=UPI0007629033